MASNAASYQQLIALNGGTAAVLQALNQYSLGLTAGYLVDQIFDRMRDDQSSFFTRALQQFGQVAVNGYLIKLMLEFVHGTPGQNQNYYDPTGGYLLLMGLIQGQPCFMRNGVDLVDSISMVLREQTNEFMQVPKTSAADTTLQT